MKVVLSGATESQRFSELLTRVVRVPHATIQARLDAEKDAKEQRRTDRQKLEERRAVGRRRRGASRASSAKD